jgi:uncharacterized membrane protein YfcA
MDMGMGEAALIAGGALVGGFVSGLTGFGTALTVLGIWLYVVPPEVAAPMVVICSTASQLLVLPRIWRQIAPRMVLPFLIPGLAGVPFGTALLASLDARALKLGIGVFLLAYSMFAARRPPARPWAGGGRAADAGLGFVSGILGGLAGVMGALLPVWATLRGWSKGEMRGVFMGFNLTVALAALLGFAVAGLVTRPVLTGAALALPGTLLGAWLGANAYGRLSDVAFRQAVLVLLGLSGAVLVIGNWAG